LASALIPGWVIQQVACAGACPLIGVICVDEESDEESLANVLLRLSPLRKNLQTLKNRMPGTSSESSISPQIAASA
jgi:hypothetical protein